MKNAFGHIPQEFLDFAQEEWDFKTCQRSDGTTYGVPSKSSCAQKGAKEVSGKKDPWSVENVSKKSGAELGRVAGRGAPSQKRVSASFNGEKMSATLSQGSDGALNLKWSDGYESSYELNPGGTATIYAGGKPTSGSWSKQGGAIEVTSSTGNVTKIPGAASMVHTVRRSDIMREGAARQRQQREQQARDQSARELMGAFQAFGNTFSPGSGISMKQGSGAFIGNNEFGQRVEQQRHPGGQPIYMTYYNGQYLRTYHTLQGAMSAGQNGQ